MLGFITILLVIIFQYSNLFNSRGDMVLTGIDIMITKNIDTTLS